MKVTRSLLVLLCLSIVAFGYSQTRKAVSKTSTPSGKKLKQEYANTLLWKISGNGLQKPSYLFGTMHILCANDALLSDSMKKVIRDAEEIYFEIDMDNMQEMMGAMKYLMMNDGKKISDLLTPEEYDKVKDYFDRNQSMLPFSMMNRFKPYFISSLIGERMMTCEKTNGMEQQIMKEARQYDKEIRGLESIEFQASIFDSIPYSKQAKDLITYIDSIENYRGVIKQMVEVYRKQDLKQMEELMLKSDPGMEEYMDLLLYGRNRKWIDLMQNAMNNGKVLFAVGAGHLPGEEGVINLLRRKGYSVSPLKN